MEIDFISITKKWQKKWKEEKIFEPEINENKKAFYVQSAYPYPSGAIHIGHIRTYLLSDVLTKFKRLKGFNVLTPMGWHVSGTPVIAGVEKIIEGNEKEIKKLKENFKISDKELEELKTPEGYVNYFINKAKYSYKNGFNLSGLGIDWRREFTTMDLNYNKFIEWQYKKLFDLGLIIKGKYPIRYCPRDKNAVGDHDLSEGEGINIQEFTLLKFKLGKKFVIAATLRPETIFGQTNLWVNEKEVYAIAKVNDEEWIGSREFFEKLKEQKEKIELLREISGKELIGQYVLAPGIEREIIILPSKFCNSEIGSGIVTSVPSDAPHDFIGLRDLQENKKECEKHGLDYEKIKEIKPIPIIKTEKYGDLTAVKVSKELGIKNQSEEKKLEHAKHIAYKEGFFKGIMNENCKKYSGMKVSEAKEKVKKELIEKGKADKFFELEGKVVCRCGTTCIVKILDDQWFIKYSDKEWKKESKKTLNKMKIIPEIYRTQYENVFEWLEDKPCTRSKGLGTKFPWDKSKIIEPLGDSTIYMAYFTISHLIKEIKPEQLLPEVFDFIFLNKGNSNELSEKTGIEKELLEKMQKEFDYWYPLAFNSSAIELIPNHMSFSIFHHTALFPEEKRQLGTLNPGMLVIDNKKMSSSKGNVILVNDFINEIGADMLRFFLINFNEPWQELNWKSSEFESGLKIITSFLKNIASQTKKIKNAKRLEEVNLDSSDEWMINQVNYRLKNTENAFEEVKLRTALQELSFQFMNDLKWFERKKKELNESKKTVLKYTIVNWLKAISPFIPHYCEELWREILENKTSIINEEWPETKEFDEEIVESEELIKRVLNDINSIKKLSKIEKPKKISLFIAPEWKWNAIKKLIELTEGKPDLKKAMNLIQEKEFELVKGELVKFIKGIIKKIPEYEEKIKLNEFKILKENKKFLEKEFNSVIEIIKSEESQEKKSKNALPGKPAILIE